MISLASKLPWKTNQIHNYFLLLSSPFYLFTLSLSSSTPPLRFLSTFSAFMCFSPLKFFCMQLTHTFRKSSSWKFEENLKWNIPSLSWYYFEWIVMYCNGGLLYWFVTILHLFSSPPSKKRRSLFIAILFRDHPELRLPWKFNIR